MKKIAFFIISEIQTHTHTHTRLSFAVARKRNFDKCQCSNVRAQKWIALATLQRSELVLVVVAEVAWESRTHTGIGVVDRVDDSPHLHSRSRSAKPCRVGFSSVSP